MAKNQQTITMKLAAGTALDILGPEGLLWGADAPEDGRYSELFNFVRCMSIAGGSDEINKNVIGERALGLPREPNPDKGVPFREVLARTKPRLARVIGQVGRPAAAVVERVGVVPVQGE